MSTKESMLRKHSGKGQAFTSDFVLSSMLFIILLVASAELWKMAESKYSNSGSSEFMQKRIFSISDALIKTEGYPINWTNETIKLIGVSEETPGVLNKSRLFQMKNISYPNMKSIWGISDYEIRLNFTNSSGSTITLGGEALEYGLAPSNKKDLVPIKRLVLINDSGNLIRSVMTMMIWR